jgi:hypothetical protein
MSVGEARLQIYVSGCSDQNTTSEGIVGLFVT